jgi:hypothetical protein
MKAVFLACASLLAVSAAHAADQCGPLKIVSTVDIQTPPNAAARVPVTIAGQPFTFRISTDGWQSVISSAAIDKLGVIRHENPVTQLNADGNYSNTVATVQDFRIGNARFSTVTLRQMVKDTPADEPQGWLANDLLRGYDVDLDFAANKLNLISRDHCPGEKAVYWPSKVLAKIPMRVTANNRIVFTAKLDGHELEATIDTGTGRTSLTRPQAESIFGLSASSPGARPADKEDRFQYRFGKIELAGLTISNPDIVIIPDATAKMPRRGGSHILASLHVHQGAPLKIGMSTLRQLHIYIDYANQMLYVTPAKADAETASE